MPEARRVERTGFQLGNHVFLPQGAPAPLSRLALAQRSPISGAKPPACLERVAQSGGPGPTELLRNGEFCGHGEPTYSVFDLIIEGDRELEVSIIPAEDGGTERFLARPAKRRGDWVVVYSRAWCSEGRLTGEVQTVPADAAEHAIDPSGHSRFRIAIGLEYPPDCASADDVTWIAVAVESTSGSFRGILCSEEWP